MAKSTYLLIIFYAYFSQPSLPFFPKPSKHIKGLTHFFSIFAPNRETIFTPACIDSNIFPLCRRVCKLLFTDNKVKLVSKQDFKRCATK